MTKKDFDLQLKTDAVENSFSVDGDFIVFDKNSNLDYDIVSGLKLRDLLTANPLSVTRLNKNLLVAIDAIISKYGKAVKVFASYRSPEYALLNFGQSDSNLFETGNAVILSCENNLELFRIADEQFTTVVDEEKTSTGEVFLYANAVHIGYTKDFKRTDFTFDQSFKQKVKNFLLNDKMKNILLIGAAAAAGWFFFLRKK